MEINVKSFLWSNNPIGSIRIGIAIIIFSFWCQASSAQRSVEEWTTYFKANYNLEILIDSTDIELLEFERSAYVTGSDGINYVAHEFDIDFQYDSILLSNHLRLLARELELYPKDFFQRIDLKYLCLTAAAKYSEQLRAAIPDPIRKALILETSERLKSDTTYQKHVFHHDLFHYVEMMTLRQEDIFKKWNKLNPKGFHYRGSGAMQFNPRYVGVDWSYVHPQEGFITNYAMTAAEEDRAELAAFLLIPEKLRILNPLVREDKTLRKKVRQIEAFFVGLGLNLESYLR